MGQMITLLVYVLPGLFGLIFVLMGGWKILGGVLTWQRDVGSISELKSGQRVALEGEARPYEETRQAPESGRECLAFTISVHNYGGAGGGGSGTHRTEATPFVLECANGTVYVAADEADIELFDDHERVSAPQPTDEWILRPGEQAYVSGTVYLPAEYDADVPSDVDLVIGAPESGGWRDRLSPLSFFLADVPHTQISRAQIKRGAKILLFGLVLPAVVIVAARIAM